MNVKELRHNIVNAQSAGHQSLFMAIDQWVLGVKHPQNFCVCPMLNCKLFDIVQYNYGLWWYVGAVDTGLEHLSAKNTYSELQEDQTKQVAEEVTQSVRAMYTKRDT